MADPPLPSTSQSDSTVSAVTVPFLRLLASLPRFGDLASDEELRIRLSRALGKAFAADQVYFGPTESAPQRVPEGASTLRLDLEVEDWAPHCAVLARRRGNPPFHPDEAARFSALGPLLEDLLARRRPGAAESSLPRLLEELSTAIGPVTGTDFFAALVEHLAKALGVRHAFVTHWPSEQEDSVRTVAFWKAGALAENRDFPLSDTPCGRVIADGSYCCSEGLIQTFPHAIDLPPLHAESFAGVAMCDTAGEVLGHLAVIHDRPLPDPDRVLAVLRLFASRAAAELLRERLEAVIRQREFDLQTVVESIPDGLMLYDGEDRMVLMNGVAKAALGITDDDWKGLTNEEIAARYPRSRASMEACQQTTPLAWECDGVYRFEEVIDIPGLGERRFDVIKVPVFDDQGRRQALVTHARDITEQRQREIEARGLANRLHKLRKMEALSQLAGGIAHDFDNLLTAILGNVELYLPKAERRGDRDLLRALGNIRASAERAVGLTHQLLAFSRRKLQELSTVEAVEAVRKTLDLLGPSLGKGIRIHRDFDLPPLRLVAGPSELDQIVMNLVLNARDAMPEGGDLRVTLRRQQLEGTPPDATPNVSAGEFLLLEVADQGQGIPPGLLAKVLEPFFTTKAVGKGTGLGLSTVFGIVSRLHGCLRVRSQVGKGTTVQVYLPCSAPEVAADPPAAGEAPPREGKLTALICAQDEVFRHLAMQLLGSTDYRVLVSRDPEEALERAFDHGDRIDLLLAEYELPGIGGPGLSEVLRTHNSDLDLIFATPSGAPPESWEDQDRSSFLHTPLQATELLNRIQDLRRLHALE